MYTLSRYVVACSVYNVHVSIEYTTFTLYHISAFHVPTQCLYEHCDKGGGRMYVSPEACYCKLLGDAVVARSHTCLTFLKSNR